MRPFRCCDYSIPSFLLVVMIIIYCLLEPMSTDPCFKYKPKEMGCEGDKSITTLTVAKDDGSKQAEEGYYSYRLMKQHDGEYKGGLTAGLAGKEQCEFHPFGTSGTDDGSKDKCLQKPEQDGHPEYCGTIKGDTFTPTKTLCPALKVPKICKKTGIQEGETGGKDNVDILVDANHDSYVCLVVSGVCGAILVLLQLYFWKETSVEDEQIDAAGQHPIRTGVRIFSTIVEIGIVIMGVIVFTIKDHIENICFLSNDKYFNGGVTARAHIELDKTTDAYRELKERDGLLIAFLVFFVVWCAAIVVRVGWMIREYKQGQKDIASQASDKPSPKTFKLRGAF